MHTHNLLRATDEGATTLFGSPLSSPTTSTTCVCFLLFQGDYCRYMAEMLTSMVEQKAGNAGTQKELASVVSNARDAYQQATAASTSLPPTAPLMLGLELNHASTCTPTVRRCVHPSHLWHGINSTASQPL